MKKRIVKELHTDCFFGPKLSSKYISEEIDISLPLSRNYAETIAI
jgi:hypothetical protein